MHERLKWMPQHAQQALLTWLPAGLVMHLLHCSDRKRLSLSEHHVKAPQTMHTKFAVQGNAPAPHQAGPQGPPAQPAIPAACPHSQMHITSC